MATDRPQDDAPDDSGTEAVSALDFSTYDLDQLGRDIRSIVDVPGAFAQAAKYTIGLPVVAVIVIWVVFNERMGVLALIPLSVISFMLSFAPAAVLGGYFVARRRLDLISDASNRVVGTVEEMHGDVVRLRDGQAETSIQQVAVGLLESAVFPAVFGTINATAETTLGPLGRFGSRFTKAPLAMVQRSVISVVESLPDKQIGDVVNEVGAALPAASAAIAELQAEYEGARSRVESVVGTVSRTTLRSTLGFALFASLPLAVWLAIGWLLS